MHPVLIQFGWIPVHTYGFLVGIGFLVGLWVIKRLALESKLAVDPLMDLCFLSLAVGFLGARILYIITQFHFFLENPLDIVKFWEGGLVFWGGPVAAVPIIIWFLRRNHIPVLKSLDVLTPGLVIGHVFGRFGCLMAGCCYGKPTHVFWGIRLNSSLVEPALRGILLHPTQVYEAISLLILFLFLLLIFKRKAFHGQVTLTYLLAYSVIRSIIETFRGDLIRGFVAGGMLSTSQFISFLVFLGGLVVFLLKLKQEDFLERKPLNGKKKKL